MEPFKATAPVSDKTAADEKQQEAEMEAALQQFPSYKVKDSHTARHRSSIVEAQQHLGDPTATLRTTTRAQAKLGYTQTSATLTWQNISCDNDSSIKLFPLCGYVKPRQMLCILGGGDQSGVPELFRILRDPCNTIYNSKDKGTYVAHGECLLNGLPPGKFYKRYVFDCTLRQF